MSKVFPDDVYQESRCRLPHLNSQFEWQQHEPVARQVGVSDDTIEAIKTRQSLDGLKETDVLVIRFAR